MDNSDLSLRVVAVVVLVVVAMLGYLAGHHHTASVSRKQTRPAFAASVLLEYPPSWRSAAAAPGIPGLPISHPAAFAPNGNAAEAGLVTGQLAGGEPSPLPTAFVEHLPTLPHTEVVDFVETEAYKYSQVSVPGFDRTLTLYAIPTPGGSPKVLACYAAPGFSADMHTCEQVVATLRLAGQPQSSNLAPDTGYAARVSALISALDRQRVALRQEMTQQSTLPAVQRLAARTAAAFSAAAASLAALEPPPAAGQAQATLSGMILKARDAYMALAAAAEAGVLSTYETAQTRVYEAEANVGGALESFALLGYAHT